MAFDSRKSSHLPHNSPSLRSNISTLGSSRASSPGPTPTISDKEDLGTLVHNTENKIPLSKILNQIPYSEQNLSKFDHHGIPAHHARCLKLLKRPLHSDLTTLVQTSPIDLLRRWCSESSVEVIGSKNRRASYIQPLCDEFGRLFSFYLNLEMPALRSAARSIGSRAMVADGMLYDILLSLLPSEFLRKVLRIKYVNKKATLRAARASAVDAQLLAGRHNLRIITESWPTAPDESLILERCSDYVKATTINPPAPCICCGRSFLADQLTRAFSFSFNDQGPLSPDHSLSILGADTPISSFFIALFF